MSEPPARIWLIQAHSDFDAADRLFRPDHHESYCQVIAKQQQAVEKSVKAIVATLATAGFLSGSIGFKHRLSEHVQSMSRLPRRRDVSGILRQIAFFFGGYRRDEIDALSGLAPSRPAPGRLAPRNTEYPFQGPDEGWVAPCEAGVFSLREIERFSTLASGIIRFSSGIVSAFERGGSRLS